MGFDPASLLAEATAAFGSGSAATGATAAATAATTTAATDAAAIGSISAGAASATGAAAATAGLSSSTLLSLGAAAGTAAAGSLLAPKPPKPGQAPQTPNMFGATKGSTALLSDSVGDVGGTFLTGNNRAPQISGGKKTLLGQ